VESLPSTTAAGPAVPTPPAQPRQGARDARVSAARLRRAIGEVNAVHTLAQPTADWAGRLAWALDPEPVVLDAATWSTIEAAVQQRARTINALLADLYTHQDVLRRRVIPPEMVLGDPFFRRACVGLEPERASPATFLRFDLVKTAAGGWMFAESFANTTVGASFAVQNRRFLTQERGDFFAALPEFRTVTDFPLRLLEHLKRLSLRDTDNPTIVLLTSGPEDPNYFEHSFLARKMGLPLAQGGDLLVLEERVFFKTIGGLVPVDVIYRRMNDRHVDPVVFNTDRLVGVPGLVSSIRARRVAVANAIGCGVADNRALEAYLPRLTRYYFGERALLPGVPTYYCGDVDQLAVVHDDTDGSLALLPTQQTFHQVPTALPGCAAEHRRQVLRELARQPHAYVARIAPQIAVTQAPTLGRGPREVRLSCFALCDGRDIEVMPGGLVHLLPTDRAEEPMGWQVGDTADVVVLASESGPAPEAVAPPPPRVRPLALGSRAADNLFWAGRYAERAEATARILSLVQDVGLEEITRREYRAWLPVWRGVLEATGNSGFLGQTDAPGLTPGLAWAMTLDAGNSSSLLTSVRAARDNSLVARDFFSPETWGVLSRLGDKLDELAGHSRHTPEARRDCADTAVTATLDGLAAFFGTVDRTMVHDSGWNFFQIGMHLERAVMTCCALRHALAEAETAARKKRREEADLTALVRLLSSQDAYRRTYQASTEPLFVAELFLLHRQAPKSIYACLLGVRDALEAISSNTGTADEPPLDATWAVLERLDALRLDQYFAQRTDSPRLAPLPGANGGDEGETTSPAGNEPAENRRLAEHVDDLLARLYSLGSSMHDFYFSHQSRLAPGATR